MGIRFTNNSMNTVSVYVDETPCVKLEPKQSCQTDIYRCRTQGDAKNRKRKL